MWMIATPGQALADLAAIWAVDDGTKVSTQQIDHPLEASNLTFDGSSIHLLAARNEIVAFQVIVEGGDAETTGVSIDLEAVGPIRNSGVSDDPDRYFVNRLIEISAQHYVPIAERTHELAWKPGTPAEPALPPGLIPDALLPVPASGVSVPARQNRGFWVDIYVPPTVAAGTYRGTVVVTRDGKLCAMAACLLDVELEVIHATLPDRPTARTMVWFSGGDENRERLFERYVANPDELTAAGAESLRRRHFQLARRHRITLFIGEDDAPTDELSRRLTGEAFSETAGYGGPGHGLPQDLYVLHSYGGRELPASEARSWQSWLSATAPDADAFYYVWDEPSTSNFDQINRLVAEAQPIPSFVTTPYNRSLDVDVFAALPSQLSMTVARRAWRAGKRTFVYNGIRPYSGTFMIDDVAISPRVNSWIQYKYGIERWFYWEATYYHDFQGGRGAIDVLSRADNFSNRAGDVCNGDGLLMYPGRDLLYPDSDAGVMRPLASIRLLNWRRGIQDVEYLALAREAGHGDLVDRLLHGMIPAALEDETRGRARVSWSESGEDWLLARRILAQAISTGEAPAIPSQLRSRPARRDRSGWIALAILLATGIVASIVLRLSRNRL